MTLLGEPLDRKKAAASLLLGLAGFTGVFFPFSIAFPPYTISVTWSLFLPMLAVLAYGRRAAFVVVAFCGMGVFPFLLWPANGWGNLVNVVIYSSWFIVHGYAADLRKAQPSRRNSLYLVQAFCSAVYTALLLLLVPLLLPLNPLFSNAAAPRFIFAGMLLQAAIAEAFLMYCMLLLCDLLLNLPVLPRLLGVRESSASRFTLKVIPSAVLIGSGIMFFYLVVETAYLGLDLKEAIEHVRSALEHLPMGILLALLSAVAGLELAKYQGREFDAEQARRRSEERLQTIYDSVYDAIMLLDPADGTILDGNRSMSELLGYAREEALGMSLADLSAGTAPYSGAEAAAWLRWAESGKPQVFEWLFRRKDGGRIWGEVSMRRALFGGVPRIFTVVRDATRRKKVEELLHESERRYRSLFESAGDAIVLMDNERFVECNDKALELFGCSWEQLLGATIARFCPARQPDGHDSAEAVRQRISDALAGDKQSFEWTGMRYDGSFFDAEVSLSRIDLPSGRFLQAIVRDVTKRKRDEEERQKLVSIIETSSDFIGFADLTGRLLYLNNAGMDLVGLGSIEEVRSKYISDFVPGTDQARLEQEQLPSIFTSGNWRGEFTLRDFKTGTLIPVEMNAFLIRDRATNQPIALANISRDISRRKQTEIERRNLLETVSRSQKMWQDTFDSITDLVSIHDRDYTVVRVNKAFIEHLGTTYDQVLGKKCYALLHAGATAPVDGCPHQRTMADGKPAQDERRDPVSGRAFLISTYPYHAPDGSMTGTIHIARDITEEKEREMRLIMTERLASLGQMASGIAHEINNPLESVMICAEMLLLRVAQGNYDRAQFEKYLKIIDEEVMRCRDITGGMLSFARQAPEGRQDVDVQLLLDKTIDLVGFQGRLRNIEVRKEYAGKVLARGNDGELRQVFLIIIVNALDAMENTGTLTIAAAVRDHQVWVRISDTGPGIPPEAQQKLFQPFYTTKLEKGGTGLGLSIAYRIISNHGGTLTVDSEPGRGAAFTISLPLAA